MSKLIKFIIKNFVMLTILPLLLLIIFPIIGKEIPNFITILIYIYGILMFGVGRAVGLGMYFQVKLDGSVPLLLVDTVKSAKYHTFTLVLLYGVFLQFLNIYLSNISVSMFVYMLLSTFIYYYFSYARIYNYIRGRVWYNLMSRYEIMILGKVRWIKYPTKLMSLVITIGATLVYFIFIIYIFLENNKCLIF